MSNTTREGIQVKTVHDAVAQEKGIWKRKDCDAMAWASGPIEYCHINSDNKICDPSSKDTLKGPWRVVCTRAEFEVEARRLGRQGEKGGGGDELPPTGWHGKCTWGNRVEWCECVILPNNQLARESRPGLEWVVVAVVDRDYKFRPFQSEREAWSETEASATEKVIDNANEAVQKAGAAIKTLESEGYEWHGGEYWAPPLGEVPERFTWRGPEDGFPPVGTFCRWSRDGYSCEVYIFSHFDGYAHGWHKGAQCGYSSDDPHDFQPLQSDRDKWLARAEEVCGGMVDLDPILETIWANGLAKLPE